jgi:hypothetical protein
MIQFSENGGLPRGPSGASGAYFDVREFDDDLLTGEAVGGLVDVGHAALLHESCDLKAAVQKLINLDFLAQTGNYATRPAAKKSLRFR